jgi:hypothetical protein
MTVHNHSFGFGALRLSSRLHQFLHICSIDTHSYCDGLYMLSPNSGNVRRLFHLYESTLLLSSDTRRGHQISLHMVVSHHVVAGNLTQELWENKQPVLWTVLSHLSSMGVGFNTHYTRPSCLDISLPLEAFRWRHRTLRSSCIMSIWLMPCSHLDDNGLNLWTCKQDQFNVVLYKPCLGHGVS